MRDQLLRQWVDKDDWGTEIELGHDRTSFRQLCEIYCKKSWEMTEDTCDRSLDTMGWLQRSVLYAARWDR